jgi:hypothetical protein
MRRELPNHPHIDHLKKQAKDLLEAHQRGEVEALERIVLFLPAFARLSPEEAARAPFALHDAQSTLAREYGFPSWKDLRAEVERRGSSAVPDAVLRALMGKPLPAAVTAAISAAWEGRGASVPPPEGRVVLPLVAMRGAMLSPGAVAPIHVARASSMAAIDAALASTPPLLAVVAQRDATVEEPDLADLHAVGCVATVKSRVPAEAGTFIVVEGQWWVALDEVTPAREERRAWSTATVHAIEVSEDLADEERDALVGKLRERATALAQRMPQPERVVALVNSIRVPVRLSDLIVANLPCALDDKARYASETTLRDRLEAAIALCDAQLAAVAR